MPNAAYTGVRLRAATVLDESGEKARPYLGQMQVAAKKNGYPARVLEWAIKNLEK